MEKDLIWKTYTEIIEVSEVSVLDILAGKKISVTDKYRCAEQLLTGVEQEQCGLNTTDW